MSQLRLALEADVSARHIAFLETGKANPTRGMVIRLSEALEVPRAERTTGSLIHIEQAATSRIERSRVVGRAREVD
ncbi:MAG: helix-turn-helix transcriptional regulator [Rhizobiales bacterium]|nr:helix-turn-helix transcriptional regulator [Hyphomicrobiales bacterium]